MMRKEILHVILTGIFLLFSPVFLLADEMAIQLGGSAGWDMIARKQQLTVLSEVRMHPALAISSARVDSGSRPDLSLSFDEGSPAGYYDASGNYIVSSTASVAAASEANARHGSGAALFSGVSAYGGLAAQNAENPIRIIPKPTALFAAGRRLNDFSIEFWLYPANMENGEQILSWTAGRETGLGEHTFQLIRCHVTRNRLEWTFSELFSSPDDSRRIPVSLSSRNAVLPRTWSHHLVRFDAEYGILEYLIDGKLQQIVYTTSSGREAGEVFAPVMGQEGSLVLGARYTGLMDEFRMHSRYIEVPVLQKYPSEGGWMESSFIDLGSVHTQILRLEADGDFNAGSASSGAAVQFFLRCADTPYRWTDDESEWIPVEPGRDLGSLFKGRWVQIAARIFPSGNREKTPFIDKIRIIYRPELPPPPPTYVMARASDSSVNLSWRPVQDPDLGGYLVYYGTASGNYFGNEADRGPSPIDVGLLTSVNIDGLRNGTLYYFSIAAYRRGDTIHEGAFSREVSARPLRMVQ